MKNKAQAAGLAFVAISILIMAAFGLMAIGKSYQLQGLQNCEYNTSGDLVNCTFTEASFTQLNNTYSTAGVFYNVTSYFPIILGLIFVGIPLIALSKRG